MTANTNYVPNFANANDGEDPHGVLVSFISDVRAERMWALCEEERQQEIPSELAAYLGEKTMHPITLYLSDMAAEEWTRGAYATQLRSRELEPVGPPAEGT